MEGKEIQLVKNNFFWGIMVSFCKVIEIKSDL